MDKETIRKSFNELQNYTHVGKLYGISRQRVHQIITGYISPAQKPKDASELKIWNSRKRRYLGIEGDVSTINGGRDKIKELVRIRDGHACTKCGKKWKEGKRRFDVHHIDPRQEGKKARGKKCIAYDKKHLDKMITMCHKCHLNLHIVREKIKLGMGSAKKKLSTC